VQVFDYGRHTDGSAYIVMELLNGESLHQRLARHGALGLPEALRIMRQVASTLGEAHARGIVHRDLKPANVFMVRDKEVAGGERAKVLDFGIAKLAGDHAGITTYDKAVMGTPPYMSPEQCRGAGHVDQRSDVYALGCMLFELLVGHPPFQAEGPGDIIAMQLREAPPVPSSLRPSIPPEVDRLVLRCLAKDPAQRFGNGSDLAVALGSLRTSSPQVRALGPGAAHTATSLPATPSPPAEMPSAVRPAALGWVVQQSGRYAGQVYPLGRRSVLGGDPGCDIVVSGAAARHAELTLQADLTWTVASLGDAMLMLNGERIHGTPRPIRDGARLDFGSTQVIFKCVGRD
jgi:serine/threonine-protein kinase